MAAEPRLNGKAATAAIFLCTAAFVIAADLLTKWLAFPAGYQYLPPRIVTIIPNFFDLIRSENHGGVFGIGQGRGAFFILFTFIASAVILWAVFKYGRTSRFLAFGLGCVFGGAIGNLWDRLMLGHVRDFIHWFVGRHDWPTFNVADSAICVGVAVLVLHSFLTPDARRETSRPKRT
jgi:signal peptidase II